MASKPVPLDQTAAASPAAAAPRPVPQGQSSMAVTKLAGGKAVGVREALEEQEELGAANIWMRDLWSSTPSWLVSMVFHMVAMLGLALWPLPESAAKEATNIKAPVEEEKEIEEVEPLEDEEIPVEDLDVEIDSNDFDAEIEFDEEFLSPADDLESAAVNIDLDDFGLETAPDSDVMSSIGVLGGTGLDGRGHGRRGGLVRKHGGTPESEKAVERALIWLSKHQGQDGGWSFKHQLAPQCGGQCRNPGEIKEARMGATAMALLPFLGMGQTHMEGKYKQTVSGGLYFLNQNIKLDEKGGALNDKGGRMYSHGLAAIVLCEAYAMTKDRKLHAPAQAVINFICYAQDPVGGGWRYAPRSPGDTSVVGWQIMALKSGHMAYLQIPPITVKKAFHFLDHVQANSGANYGYTSPGEGAATTAIGLLCRMYLGWKKSSGVYAGGVGPVAKLKPRWKFPSLSSA